MGLTMWGSVTYGEALDHNVMGEKDPQNNRSSLDWQSCNEIFPWNTVKKAF
jgi:hypothetical protein